VKSGLALLVVVVGLSALAGCEPPPQDSRFAIRNPNLKTPGQAKVLLTVDFQQGQTLQYKFLSSREIDLDWDPAKTASGSAKNTVNKFSESVEMIVAYTPVEVNPYGLTTIKATCKKVVATRSKGTGGRPPTKDAVESFAGKTYALTVGPTGRIEDYSELNKLIQEIGKEPFREDSKAGRVKEPDMIGDFVASQWFLWDSISSIEKPTEGVSIGQTWRSKLSVPTPMVMRKARDVTYRLSEIRQAGPERSRADGKGGLAVIQSSYCPADSVPNGWPIPYSGKFQMTGTFGFLSGYQVMDLKGQGEELFNIELGRIEQSDQQYQMQLAASLPLPIGPGPRITIKQKLSMQLLE
jgi:hypothetical protein